MPEHTLNRPGRLDIALNRVPLKQVWDGLALGQVMVRGDLDLGQKMNCARFYLTGGKIRNLYPTLTRSGSHWSLLGIALAQDLAHGGSGEYEYEADFWLPRNGVVYTKLDWREPTGNWDAKADAAILGIARAKAGLAGSDAERCNRQVIYHTHHPYFRLRCANLGRMRIAVVVRNIYDSMESKYFKHIVMIGNGERPHEYSQAEPGEVLDPPSEDNEHHFPWEKLLNDAIEFFNSWGDVMMWHKAIRVFHYEDMLADPVSAHKEMTDFWGMNLPVECLTEAFRRITKEEMKMRLPDQETKTNVRVAFRQRAATLTEDRAEFMRGWLERRLVHDFGYGSEWTTRTPA